MPRPLPPAAGCSRRGGRCNRHTTGRAGAAWPPRARRPEPQWWPWRPLQGTYLNTGARWSAGVRKLAYPNSRPQGTGRRSTMTTGFRASTKASRDRRGVVVVVGRGRYLARPSGVADFVAVKLDCLCRRCRSGRDDGVAGFGLRPAPTTTCALRPGTGGAGEATMLMLDEIADGIYRISRSPRRGWSRSGFPTRSSRAGSPRRSWRA
jgi:hypothetical protein